MATGIHGALHDHYARFDNDSGNHNSHAYQLFVELDYKLFNNFNYHALTAFDHNDKLLYTNSYSDEYLDENLLINDDINYYLLNKHPPDDHPFNEHPFDEHPFDKLYLEEYDNCPVDKFELHKHGATGYTTNICISYVYFYKD
ncbi:hypothetical protein B0A49_13215 [Cryomyces minteri]|uniref:Uncharacterized protein n=1 Tax=Cryomyces minteri TaxID=331657 RepID=A0A4U0VBL4_9PEZI|nr:hypothetical protein B0A49_13215 [Cryomyces minteri]